jgi:hypothetical protein
MRRLFILFLLLLVGCGANQVNKVSEDAAQEPVEEVSIEEFDQSLDAIEDNLETDELDGIFADLEEFNDF